MVASDKLPVNSTSRFGKGEELRIRLRREGYVPRSQPLFGNRQLAIGSRWYVKIEFKHGIGCSNIPIICRSEFITLMKIVF